jgi:pimeloyl-ACP methyl ester carboxylesterase
MSTQQASVTEHRVPTENGNLFVKDYAGGGDPFVLMHGFPDNHHIYDALAPLLAAGGRRTIVFDFLGFGQSDRASGKYGFAQQLGDLKAVVRELNLGRVVPVGHDASGPAALNLAVEQPESVAGVVLLNSLYAAGSNIRVPELVMLFATANLNALSGAIASDPAQLAWLLKFQQKMFHDALPADLQPGFLAKTASIINDNFLGERSSGEAFAELAADLLPEVGRNTAQIARLAGITVPVSLIWGDYDAYLNPGVAKDLMPHLKNATFTTLPTGHWPQLDAPADVARLMLA